MRSIERRFISQQNKHPNKSSLLNFAAAVKGQYFKAVNIGRRFTKLVDKEDYSKRERKDIIHHLYSLSNPSTTTENEPKMPFKGGESSNPIEHSRQDISHE